MNIQVVYSCSLKTAEPDSYTEGVYCSRLIENIEFVQQVKSTANKVNVFLY